MVTEIEKMINENHIFEKHSNLITHEIVDFMSYARQQKFISGETICHTVNKLLENMQRVTNYEIIQLQANYQIEELSKYLSARQENYFNNIMDYPQITDLEREQLINIVEKKIRIKFPKQATTILGGKSEKAKELLEEFLSLLKNEFNGTKNCSLLSKNFY